MIKPDARRSLGANGEIIAVHALEKAGLTIVERNWRCAVGEIDIVAQENGPDFVRGLASTPWLVIVEVRTRRGNTYGTALQSIVPRKQRKLRQVARTYVQYTGWRGPWRIDVVGIQMDSQGQALSVEHVRHAVHDE
jgi:putative endonuclease